LYTTLRGDSINLFHKVAKFQKRLVSWQQVAKGYWQAGKPKSFLPIAIFLSRQRSSGREMPSTIPKPFFITHGSVGKRGPAVPFRVPQYIFAS